MKNIKTFQTIPEQLYTLVSEEQGIGEEIMIPVVGKSVFVKTRHIKLNGLEMAIGVKKDDIISTFILYQIIPPVIVGKKTPGLLAILYIEGGKINEDEQIYLNELQHFYSFGSSADFDPLLIISFINERLSFLNREGQPKKAKIHVSKIERLMPFKK